MVGVGALESEWEIKEHTQRFFPVCTRTRAHANFTKLPLELAQSMHESAQMENNDGNRTNTLNAFAFSACRDFIKFNVSHYVPPFHVVYNLILLPERLLLFGWISTDEKACWLWQHIGGQEPQKYEHLRVCAHACSPNRTLRMFLFFRFDRLNILPHLRKNDSLGISIYQRKSQSQVLYKTRFKPNMWRWRLSIERLMNTY